MAINEEAKIKIFALKSMAAMYGKTDEELGRFCRGFTEGVNTAMHAAGLKDALPAECPDDERTTVAAFCALYGTYVATERRPRLDKGGEDHKMMYGKAAQAMMAEAERVLDKVKKREKAGDN